jgi:acid phosphatase family membrane protein YuiD
MDWFFDLIQNPFLITSISSWAIAQVLKTIIHWCVYKKLDLGRLHGDGGMPSCHSATVASLAMICALVKGTGSAEFAISLILAIIVCHDAMGVRRETGRQAVVLNELTRLINILSSEELPAAKLKEFVGHTPLQVTVGILLGIAHAVLMYNILPGLR